MIEVKAQLTDMSFSLDKKARLTFSVEQIDLPSAEKYMKTDLRLTMKVWKEKRSLDANGYYWVLISKLAGVHKLSQAAVHNTMLRDYGQPEIIDGRLVELHLPDTEETEKRAINADTFHIKPTSRTYEDETGQTLRVYIMLRGSHTYNTEEFSRLIDGLCEECRAEGIEVMTPDELAHMKELYEKEHNSRNNA